MKTLYLMRHGETLFNVLHKIQGWCDSPLTSKGIQQALLAKKWFEEHQIHFDHAYSSTSERCCDTLEIIIRQDTPYKRLKQLKERNFGDFEGESEDLNPKRWSEFNYDDLFPHYGGEYTHDVVERMSKCLLEIMENDDHQNVLAVSHGGACYSFLSSVTDPNIVRDNGGFTNCCILHFEYNDGKFKYIDILRPEFS